MTESQPLPACPTCGYDLPYHGPGCTEVTCPKCCETCPTCGYNLPAHGPGCTEVASVAVFCPDHGGRSRHDDARLRCSAPGCKVVGYNVGPKAG